VCYGRVCGCPGVLSVAWTGSTHDTVLALARALSLSLSRSLSAPDRFGSCCADAILLDTVSVKIPNKLSLSRARGLLVILGLNLGGVGPVRGLQGGGRRGWCEE
jgi:hypothetical protein